MFHLAAYTASATAAATNFDFTAVTDPELTTRNGHFIFTEQYKLLATAFTGAGITTSSLLTPSWNAIGRMNSYPNDRSAQPVSNTFVDLRLGYEAMIPQKEELQAQASNNAGAADREWCVIWVGTMQHSPKLPMPAPPGFNMIIRATATITGVALTWSGPIGLTFEQSLRGGVYSLVGCDCFVAGCEAFRMVFPRNPLYNGRRLRPGGIPQNALGDFPPLFGVSQARLFGEWGRFHTFEPPQVEVLPIAAGAVTLELRMHVVFLGDYDDPLQGFTAA